MMRQALTEARPERRHEGMSPAIGGTVPLAAGLAAVRTHPLPGAPVRQRLAQWRARNWRRAVLAWFVLSLIIVIVAAEPKTDFPKAQLRSVPAARMFLRVAGELTAAGVPVLLVALP